jgi:hypothetical protein
VKTLQGEPFQPRFRIKGSKVHKIAEEEFSGSTPSQKSKHDESQAKIPSDISELGSEVGTPHLGL